MNLVEKRQAEHDVTLATVWNHFENIILINVFCALYLYLFGNPQSSKLN
jgi:hypothetical protein